MDGNWQYWLHRGFHLSLASVLAKSCKVSIWITACLLVSVKSYKTISAGFQLSVLTSCHPAKRELMSTACTVQESGHKARYSSPAHQDGMFSYRRI